MFYVLDVFCLSIGWWFVLTHSLAAFRYGVKEGEVACLTIGWKFGL